MFNFGELATAGYLYTAVCFALSVLLISIKNIIGKEKHYYGVLEYTNINVASAAIIWLAGYSAPEIIVISALSAAIMLIIHRLLRNLTIAGRLLIASYILFSLFSLLWGIWFINSIDVSIITRVLMLVAYPLLLLTLFGGIITTFEQWEVLGKEKWLRPHTPLPEGSLKRFPKVCLQVPAYSEPPDVVISTLNSIAELDYPNFEVIVIDNNTKDHAIWKPVEQRCVELGERFRFFHVSPLAGAKAGALNYIHKYVSADVEVIGVVDSDYQVKKGFLSRLVGYFEDPKIGFVQTPHDYREWGESLYQRMCYWEYKYFFETVMPSLNERDGTLTVGTMCLIRKKALEDVGGWAEWCATEDSELSIRIHAAGYSSVYTSEAFGHGLIPETFSGYKKQRFRWTYGPVQELKRHFWLYLPKSIAAPSKLTALQKLHHLNHGFGYLNLGLGALAIPLGFTALASMIYQKEIVEIPYVFLIGSGLAIFSSLILRWLVYHVYMKCSFMDTIGAYIANCALSHTYIVASIKCLFAGEIQWHRTNKFKALPLGLGALSTAQTELFIAITLFAVGIASFFLSDDIGLNTLLGAGFILKSFDYLAAPALVLLSEYEIRKSQDPVKFITKSSNKQKV